MTRWMIAFYVLFHLKKAEDIDLLTRTGPIPFAPLNLGFKESSSVSNGEQNYDIENPFGFIGKYQFGETALFDLDYYGHDNSDSNLFKNNWVGNWSAGRSRATFFPNKRESAQV